MTARRKREWTEFAQFRTWPFIGVHLVAIGGVIYSGWSWSGFALAIGLYYARMFFVTAGYHRYFSHRSFKTSRVFQFILALGGCCTIQKGPLWWAANHRHHHRASDQEDDIHSPVVHGFWWSHLGWVLVEDYQHTAWDDIRDMAKFRELRWLNRYDLVPVIAMALLLQVFWGWHALLWGFFVSSTLLWHGTFTINSLSHVFGSRRYDTGDASRNNWFLAIVTMGEGWHNNHHHYMNSANQGFFWWEIDMSYILLRIL
ncbi:MAG: fatty acid desaturase, partial [Kofleriaceae bacterium]|nr:fatty acid desaturase [Kofleriaceae bacterium]